ncbi:hypothetical protein HZS_6726 [Henneguya salminicola]|nr:hypothetical protein HZS_6726 [Henneguya salminicola]
MIVPKENSLSFLQSLHEYFGHPGGRIMVGMRNPFLKVPGLNKIFYRISSSCELCSRNKSFNPRKGKLVGGLYSERAGTMLSTEDMVGPVESSLFQGDLQASKFWILTCSDIFTRYSIAMLLEYPNSESVCKLLDKHWLTKFGAPKTLISDQGRPYIAKSLKSFLNEPNAISERINSIISTVLRSYACGNITNVLEIVNKRLNLCFHRILNASTHEMMFGYSS